MTDSIGSILFFATRVLQFAYCGTSVTLFLRYIRKDRDRISKMYWLPDLAMSTLSLSLLFQLLSLIPGCVQEYVVVHDSFIKAIRLFLVMLLTPQLEVMHPSADLLSLLP